MLIAVGEVLAVGEISAEEHLGWVKSRSSASFLQTPAWGSVKDGWRAESIGWRRDGELVGAALVLYRRVPALARYLAYTPEGPLIDWSPPDLRAWLDPMRDYLHDRGAFALRIGPPVVSRVWEAATVKQALADESHVRLGGVPPDELAPIGLRVEDALRATGWQGPPAGSGFPAGQPRYVVQLPLAGESEESLLARMSKQWRRNIKKAGTGELVTREGSAADLRGFHRIYLETAQRNGFRPRSARYFATMYEALGREAGDRIGLHIAEHRGRPVAAMIRIKVGEHVWYAYGASSNEGRELRGPNAVQWHGICRALREGSRVYDLRGITDSVDPNCPSSGLLRFKLGTGGRVVGYVGEWTLPISRPLYAAFDLFMRHRFRVARDG